MMRVSQGHIASFDGTEIFYQVIGAGRPLFCCHGLGVPAYYWQHLVAQFGNDYQIITWDQRGHGRSALPEDPRQIRFEDLIADGLAVLRHVDLQGAIGIGHSTGWQALLGAYGQEAWRFAGLVSFLGTDGHCLEHFYDAPESRRIFDVLYILTVFFPKQVGLAVDLLTRTALPYHWGGLLGLVDPKIQAYEDLRPYFEHFRAMDPHFFAALGQAAGAHTARPILRKIRVPTLYIAAEADQFVPLRIAKAMHQRTKGSELHIIPAGSHAALMERPAVFNTRLGQFLWKHRLTSTHASTVHQSEANAT
jgi:pimeloyl-ACP methyl ester carboxylesterase